MKENQNLDENSGDSSSEQHSDVYIDSKQKVSRKELFIKLKENPLNIINFQGNIEEIEDYFITGYGEIEKVIGEQQTIKIKSNFVKSVPNGISNIKYPDGSLAICNFNNSYIVEGKVEMIFDKDHKEILWYENNIPVKILQMWFNQKAIEYYDYDQYGQPRKAKIKSDDKSYEYDGQINADSKPHGIGNLRCKDWYVEKGFFINGELYGINKKQMIDSDDYYVIQQYEGQEPKILESYVKGVKKKILRVDGDKKYGTIECDKYKYEGYLDNDFQMEGYGILEDYRNNEIYQGYFSKNQFNGEITRYITYQEDKKKMQKELEKNIYENGKIIVRKFKNIFDKANNLIQSILFQSGNEQDGYKILIKKYDQNEELIYEQDGNCIIDKNNQIQYSNKYLIKYKNGKIECGFYNEKGEKQIEKEEENNYRFTKFYKNCSLIKQYDHLQQQLLKFSELNQKYIVSEYYGEVNENYEPQSKYGIINTLEGSRIVTKYGKFENGNLIKEYKTDRTRYLTDEFQIFEDKYITSQPVKCGFYDYHDLHIIPIYIETQFQRIDFIKNVSKYFIKDLMENKNIEKIIQNLKFYGTITQNNQIIYQGEINYLGIPLK